MSGSRKPPGGRISRGFRIGRLGLALTGSYLGYQFQNVFLDKEERREKRKTFQTKAARQIREGLGSLKGPVMKLGQMLSMQSHLLPEEVLSELANLQMRAPAMHSTLARAQFKASFGKFPEDVFRSFADKPFAAASLGQVHRAVTKDGQDVAVKIQYPAIRTAIEDDFKLLRSAALPARFTGHATESMVAEVERGILEETDYVNEGRNIDFFRVQLKSLDYIRVPFVHWDLSTDRVLTMSLVLGEPLPDFLAKEKPAQEARNRIGARLLKLFDLQLHHIHAIHADPHPGNYLIDSNGTIGLVDFGCVKKFSAEFIEIMRAFEQRIWLHGEEHSRRLAQLLWGPRVFDKSARKLLKGAIDFYEMLFPTHADRGAVIDFGDAKILTAMFRIWNDCLRTKTANPEFAFYGRAEMGLYNLLHMLRAKLDTCAVLTKPDSKRAPN